MTSAAVHPDAPTPQKHSRDNTVSHLDDKSQTSLSLTAQALRRLRRDRLTLIAITLLLLMTITAFVGPLIAEPLLGTNYRTTDTKAQFLQPGSPGHPLGTDDLGRDHFIRLLYGGQVSLSVAVMSGVISLVLGVSLGLFAGYYQGTRLGFVDDLLLWFITTLNSIPSLYLLVLIAAILNPTVFVLILILSLFSWTFTMRLVRAQTLTLRETEYVIAARAMGAGPVRIMFGHILPNLFSVIVVDLASNVGSLILAESALSFLNLGVRQPTPSWGNMLSNAQSFFRLGVHLVIFPGLLIVVTVLCLYLIGDGLRDAFDPQATKKV